MTYAYEGARRRVHLDFPLPHRVKQVGHRFESGNPALRRVLTNALDLVIPVSERLVELERPTPNLEVSLMAKAGD